MESQRKKSVIREINALKKLNHENIMKLYDVIDTPKQLFLVMEFVPGLMLSTYLRGKQLQGADHMIGVD